jgi:hypothetical protein
MPRHPYQVLEEQLAEGTAPKEYALHRTSYAFRPPRLLRSERLALYRKEPYALLEHDLSYNDSSIWGQRSASIAYRSSIRGDTRIFSSYHPLPRAFLDQHPFKITGLLNNDATLEITVLDVVYNPVTFKHEPHEEANPAL